MSNWPLTPVPSPWPYRWRGTKWKWTFSPTTLVSYICISYLVMPSFCHFYHIQRICPSHNYWKKIKVVFFFRHCCHISANGDDQNDVSWSYIYILEVDYSVFDCLNYYMLNKTDWYASSAMFFSLTLDNLESQNEYLVSLDLQVCLESGSACAISVSVLKNTKLQKTNCDWTAGLGGR